VPSIWEVRGNPALPAGRAVLELVELTGGWGPTTIVERLSLNLAAGETVAIVGRNGVGKTTVLELIAGRAQWQAGEVRMGGRDISRLPIHERARLGIGYVPQQREIFSSLTVREHLAIAARPGPWSRDKVIELFPSLSARFDSLGAYLSGGEQQMLAIARALVTNPSILLMDEPSEGLAPVVVEQLVAAVRDVVGGRTLAVLLVEQRVDIALDLASRCIVLDRGRIVSDAPSEDYRNGTIDVADAMGLGVQ
jgi:branched-chain amino acid transport system ATP-binding protein